MLGYTTVYLVYRGGNYEGPEEEEEGGPVEGKIHFRPEEDDKPGKFFSTMAKGFIKRKSNHRHLRLIPKILCLSVNVTKGIRLRQAETDIADWQCYTSASITSAKDY